MKIKDLFTVYNMANITLINATTIQNITSHFAIVIVIPAIPFRPNKNKQHAIPSKITAIIQSDNPYISITPSYSLRRAGNKTSSSNEFGYILE